MVKKSSIFRLLSAPAIYVSSKFKGIYKKLTKKRTNNGANNVKKPKNNWLARLRRNNNKDKLKKEDLKSKSSNARRDVLRLKMFKILRL